jgi:hypothetical protein
MHDIFDLKGYIDKLIATINETCDNARNALNILMGISVVMGGLILGVDDEILFLDQGASVPYAGIPITVSTVFALFPVVYLVIYGLLGLKLLSIVNITKEFTTTRDILIYKTESELLYPLTQYTHLLLKIAPSAYNNQLKSFFFLDALLHKGRLAIGRSTGYIDKGDACFFTLSKLDYQHQSLDSDFSINNVFFSYQWFNYNLQ